MIFTTLDQIVRRGLLEDGLPIHYYAELLFHGSTAIRELSYDTLKIINTANLPIDDYGAIDLPDDFVDDIGVGIGLGGSVSPIPKQDALSRIRIHSTTTGQFVPNTSNAQLVETETNDNNFFGFYGAFNWFWNVNDWGEPTGRFYGSQGGTQQGYKLVKERRQIQLTDNFIGGNVILSYISDGQSIDNATQVDTLAFQAIRSFQEWKRSKNANDENSPEGRAWYNQRRLLRARLNDVTIVDILNTIRNSYFAAPKN